MTEWKKVGARSRARGYRFEKDVEHALRWQRVPMSGAAGSAFGSGDVIDGYINGAGFWLAECKMRTSESGTVAVEGAWIEKADRDAERSGRFVAIIVGVKHERGSKPEAFVFLGPEAVRFLLDRVTQRVGRRLAAPVLAPEAVLQTRTASRSGGFCVRRPWLDRNPGVRQFRVEVTHPGGGRVDSWLALRLERFAEILHGHGAYVENTHKED